MLKLKGPQLLEGLDEHYTALELLYNEYASAFPVDRVDGQVPIDRVDGQVPI